MEATSSPETTGASGSIAANSPPISKFQPGAPPSSASTTGPTHKKHGKRDRVALACQRCKTRKQKCDGARPACASCSRLSLKCVYIIPLIPAAGEKKIYIKALEQRVAELESQLAAMGQFNVGDDHLRTARLGGNMSFGGQPSQLGHLEPHAGNSDDEANDILLAVRDLSLSASGHYVGASSNINIGRVLSSVVNSQRALPRGMREEGADEDDPTPKSVSTRMSDLIGGPYLTPQVAQRLLEGWFAHIATRYPVLHTPRLLELHNNRQELTNIYEKSVLHLAYAISGRWLESAGVMGHFFSDQHYDLAYDNLESVLKLRDARTLDYLILMALYCTRAPRDPGAWTYVGAAMRLCVELGLHRRQRRQPHSIETEMNKRRFWTTYFLDRDISIALGRPPSISDHDIDAELPFDIDEAIDSDATVRQAALQISNFPRSPPSTMTSFLHRTRLKRIESAIQHTVYRVDQATRMPEPTIQQYLDQLNAWKESIPFEARNHVQQPGMPFEGVEFYTIHYYRCVRFLLYPQLANNPVNMDYLRICADACAGITSDYRRLHHVFPVGFSALSIQSVFLAGLNLIYCAWLAPANFLNAEGPLTDCQILLYIITERYPSARKYRDIFERIKTSILSLIACGEHQPRNPVDLDADVRARVATLEGTWAVNGMGNDFSQMINVMTGGQLNVEVGAAPAFEMAPSLDGSQGQASAGDMWPTNMELGMDPMPGIF